MNSNPPRNSKQIKIPPNNINININFTMKQPLPQSMNSNSLLKPIAGKKIDNYVHVSTNTRNNDIRRANVTTQTLKDRKRQLMEQQDSSNQLLHTAQLLKTKRLDAPIQIVKAIKRKERSAKASQTHQEIIQTAFSTSKLKNKNYSRQLREMLAKGGRDAIGYLNVNVPTPLKNASGDKTRRKSADRERKRKTSNQKIRNPNHWKMSRSVQNLTRHRIYPGQNRTPSRQKSKSSGSKGSSTKRRNIPVTQQTERLRNGGSVHNNARRSQIGVDFLNELEGEEIKHILKKSRKNSIKRFRASQAQNQKFTEEEVAQIRAYMMEKKRRFDREKREKQIEERNRLERMRDSLNKVQIERKTNAKVAVLQTSSSKKSHKKKPSIKKNIIISTRNHEGQFVELQESSKRLLNLHENTPKDKQLSNQKNLTSSSTKKNTTKQPLKSFVENYEYMNQCAIKIQKVIRGYLSRKHTLQQLQAIRQKVRQVEEHIDNRRKQFWGNNSNSIIQVQQDIDHSESLHPSQNNHPDDNPGELSINESWQFNHRIHQPKSPQLSEQEEDDDQSNQVYRMIQKLERDPRNNRNIELARKLKGVAESIRKKQQENRKIIRENLQLRQNMKSVAKEDIHNNSEDEHPRTFDSGYRPNEQDPNFEFHIRMPVKISPPQTKRHELQINNDKPQPSQPSKLPFLDKTDQISQQEKAERKREVEALKKFKEQSDGFIKKTKKTELSINPNAPSIPSSQPSRISNNDNLIKQPDQFNHHFEAVRSPKNQELNILELLRQKETLLSDKHRLSSEEINTMYRNKLVSPRSYARRLSQLEKIKEERSAIQRSMEQAEKIMNFVKNIDKDKQEVKRLEEVCKSRRSSEGGLTQEMKLKIYEAEKPQRSQQGSGKMSMTSSNEDIYQASSSIKSDDSDRNEKQPSFMQPLPVPIESKKIENIFKAFEQEEQENTNKKSIISIFQQTVPGSSRTKPHQNDVEEQIDNLTNQMVEFVEELQQNASEPQAAARAAQQQQLEKPGFETNLNLIKQYCVGICELIKSDDRLKQQFKRQMMTPLSYNYKQFLSSYRRTETGTYTNQYNSFRDDLMYPFYRQSYGEQRAITQQVFNKFNERFSVKLKRHQPKVKQQVVELQSIFLKAILDVFNEALDYQRPNSILGRPMPWISKSKYLKNLELNFDNDLQDQTEVEYTKEHEKLDMVFGGSIARVIQWGSALCGFIPDAIEDQKGQLVQMDDDYINHIKQTRLALMLEKTVNDYIIQLTQDQDKLLEFADEQTEVKLETANKIVEMLCAQLARDLKLIMRKQIDGSDEDISQSQFFDYIDD